MAEWEGLLIVLTFLFAIAGGLCWLVVVECDIALGRTKGSLMPPTDKLLAQMDKVALRAGRWRMAKNFFFFLFFVGFILAFSAHISR